jgi:hypothetical protein
VQNPAKQRTEPTLALCQKRGRARKALKVNFGA